MGGFILCHEISTYPAFVGANYEARLQRLFGPDTIGLDPGFAFEYVCGLGGVKAVSGAYFTRLVNYTAIEKGIVIDLL